MAMRIDTLKPGTTVTLRFHYRGDRTDEQAEFLGIEGEGEKRHAKFSSSKIPGGGQRYEWEAYRYKNRWAYGTSADRLTLVSVNN